MDNLEETRIAKTRRTKEKGGKKGIRKETRGERGTRTMKTKTMKRKYGKNKKIYGENKKILRNYLAIKKNIDFEKRFKKSVLILKGDKLYRINETGKLIWDFLGKIHPDEMAKTISEVKKIPIERVKEKIYDFINQLQKHGIVEFSRKKQ